MLHHSIVGHGLKPVVLLHGFLGSGRNLSTFAKQWTERDPTLRCLLVDLPGHGRSPPLAASADLDTLALETLHFCRSLQAAPNTAKLALVGHSLGGRVALKTYAMEPPLFERVTFLDVSPAPMLSRYAEIDAIVDVLPRAPDRVARREDMRQYFVEHSLSPSLTDWLLLNLERQGSDFVWRIDRERLCELQLKFRRDDLWDEARVAGAHGHCIRGGMSSYVSDADCERLRGLGCRVDTIPHASHFIHVDALNELVSLLLAP